MEKFHKTLVKNIKTVKNETFQNKTFFLKQIFSCIQHFTVI